MPVIVVGADTEVGGAIIDALLPRQGEVRAFVSDADTGLTLKERGVKVAIGDVSDASHVGGAALNTFSAVLVAEAASDERERAFASTPQSVFAAWTEGVTDAAVQRVIWVGDATEDPSLASAVPEFGRVPIGDSAPGEIASAVAALDEAKEI